MRSALSWRITQCIAIIIYRSFGRTFRSDLARVKNSKRNPATLGLYRCRLRDFPEQSRSLLLCGGSLKTSIKFTTVSCFEILSQTCISIDVIHRPQKHSILYPLHVRCGASNGNDVTQQHRN